MFVKVSIEECQQVSISGNVYFLLPLNPNIFGLFADFGLFNSVSKNTFVYNTGIGIRVGKVVGIYFPIFMSKNLNDSYYGANYVNKIRLTLKMNIVNKPLAISGLL